MSHAILSGRAGLYDLELGVSKKTILELEIFQPNC